MKILLSATLALLLLGCSSEQSSSAKEEVTQSVQKVAEVTKVVKKEVEVTAKKAVEKTVNLVEESENIVAKKDAVVKKTVESKKVLVQKPTKVVVHKKPVKEVTEPVVAKINGAKLFVKCASCHGQNAEKKALNKSNIIKGWSTDKTITAINGYKDGSYGSSMKGVMKPQVAKLTKAEVQALAEYISKL